MATDLASRKCVPCTAATARLQPAEIATLLPRLSDWLLRDGSLVKQMRFKDFKSAMAFLGRVADLAEDQGHHPDFCVHYKIVDFTLYTHAIGGLSENDFVLAAKIDALVKP